MTRHSRIWINGFEVLSDARAWSPGLCRCGGCEAVMSNLPAARDTHREQCPELQRLDKMAEEAAERSVRNPLRPQYRRGNYVRRFSSARGRSR